MHNYQLFTPGPTPIPPQVLRRMSEPIIHHRSSEFREIFTRVNKNLKYLFQTAQPVLTLACSGTGGIEATFLNLFSPGDTIISVNGGKFGERWVAMPMQFGMNVIEIKNNWGDAPTEEQILSSLRQHPKAKAVYLTHCETSTATATEIQFLAAVIRNSSNALVCVDGISAVGGLEMRFDEWGIDVCVTASQKGLMTPPGLAVVALSERAVAQMKFSRLPKYYFDLKKSLNVYEKNDSPWTPSISLIAGLDVALEMIREEGIENVWKRHQRFGNVVRAGMREIGLKLLSKSPSDTVTALLYPSGINASSFRNLLKNKHGIIVGGGQGDHVEKLFRIGHVGYYQDQDITSMISAVKDIFSDLGFGLQHQSG